MTHFAVGHCQVCVGAGLEEHFGALFAARLLDPRRDVQRGLADAAT